MEIHWYWVLVILLAVVPLNVVLWLHVFGGMGLWLGILHTMALAALGGLRAK